MKKTETFENCSCLSDCKSTMLSVFDTRQQLDLDQHCNNMQIIEYTKFILSKHKLWFLLNRMNKKLQIEQPLSSKSICKYLVSHNLVIVKVEMATKSMMRSVRDKRFSFETQLASLGNIELY